VIEWVVAYLSTYFTWLWSSFCPFSWLLLFNLLSVISTTIYLDCWKFIPLGCIGNKKVRVQRRNRKRAEETLHSVGDWVRDRDLSSWFGSSCRRTSQINWFVCVHSRPRRISCVEDICWGNLRPPFQGHLDPFCAWLLGSCLDLCLHWTPFYTPLFTWWAYCGQGWTLACFWCCPGSWILNPESWILDPVSCRDKKNHPLPLSSTFWSESFGFVCVESFHRLLFNQRFFNLPTFWPLFSIKFGLWFLTFCLVWSLPTLCLVTHCPYLNDLTRTKADPDTEHSSRAPRPFINHLVRWF